MVTSLLFFGHSKAILPVFRFGISALLLQTLHWMGIQKEWIVLITSWEALNHIWSRVRMTTLLRSETLYFFTAICRSYAYKNIGWVVYKSAENRCGIMKPKVVYKHWKATQIMFLQCVFTLNFPSSLQVLRMGTFTYGIELLTGNSFMVQNFLISKKLTEHFGVLL